MAMDPLESFPNNGAGYSLLVDREAGHVRVASLGDLKRLLIKVLELEKVDYLLIGC